MPVIAHHPGLASVTEHNLAPVLGPELLELGVEVLDDEVGDALDGEVGYETDGEFALDRAGDDGLGAGRS